MTWPARYPKSFTFKGEPGQAHNIVSLPNVESFLKNHTLTDEDKEIMNDLRGWYKMECEEFNNDVCELMIDDIRRLRPDTIFISSFGGSFLDNIAEKLNIRPHQSLDLLYFHQMKQLKLDEAGMNSSWLENSYYIAGHLTPEYNRIVYEALSHRLKTGEWTLEEPKSIKFDLPVDSYYFKG